MSRQRGQRRGAHDGFHCGCRLVAGLLVLKRGHRVSDNAGTSLHRGDAILKGRRADRDRKVRITRQVEVANDAAVDTAR